MSIYRFIALSVFVSACGSGAQKDGVIANLNGSIEVLTESEAASVCENHFCEPNYVYYTTFGKKRKPAPPQEKEPEVTSEWKYNSFAVNLPDAWKKTKGNQDIVVAVIDTGVDLSHPDLDANLWVNEAEKNGLPGVDDDQNGYIDDIHGYDFESDTANVKDDQGHGTHVAGTIASEMNEMGSVGVAPNVKIMSLSFIGEFGGSTADAIRAIEYAVANGADVISNSWGSSGRSRLLGDAIADAIAAGVTVVAAAGNSGTNNNFLPHYPSNFDDVIAVGATNEENTLSSYSNYGDESVWLTAPGDNILSTLPEGKWGELTGTSMATPHVSGAIALALSMNPDLSPAEISEMLCNSAKPAGLNSVQCGQLDVAAFLNQI